MTDRMTDRLPPQDLEAEQATLGAMLMESGAVRRARAILADAGDFYREAHRIIYSCVCAVDDAGEPVDLVTVGAELRRREQLAKCGGAEYLTRLIGECPTTAHVIRYATIVHEKAQLRNLILRCSELQAAAFDNPATLTDLTMQAQGAIREWAMPVSQGRATQHVANDGMRERLRRDLESPPGISLARTGITTFDKATGGLAGHSVVVPMASTKAGKSIFSMNCALTSAQGFRDHAPGTYVLCYILEAYAVWRRRASAWLGHFNSQAFRRGAAGDTLLHEQFESAEDELERLPLAVNDALRDVNEIAVDARNVFHDRLQFPDLQRVGLIVIDHAQRLSGPGEMVERYEHIGLALETLANDLRCPIVLPSQVTLRDGQAQTKWSRAIEENASLVIHMTRGDEGEAPAEAMLRDWGTLECVRTREDSFGVVDYHVDIGNHRGQHSDLRLYDVEDWNAQGWPTRDQQKAREEVEAARSAGYAGSA